MNTTQTLQWLPTSVREVKERGWDVPDVILFSGDAYVDHPSFGGAVVGRLLESLGLKVALVPQPNWQDDLRDFRKLGTPRLFFGVSAGSMDSMVNPLYCCQTPEVGRCLYPGWTGRCTSRYAFDRLYPYPEKTISRYPGDYRRNRSFFTPSQPLRLLEGYLTTLYPDR